MLCLCPPNAPGVYYRIECDMATAERFRMITSLEVERMVAAAKAEENNDEDEFGLFHRR